MGNPDLPAPAHVIEKMKETLGKPRTDRYSASRGIAGPAPRAGGLLRAPLRREAQSRHADRRDARLQGRLRQRRAGDHRAGRRRAGAQPELSDPRLRLPDGGRRDPLGAVGADAEFLPHARARDHALDPEADRGGGLLSGQSDALTSRRSISTRTSSPSRRSTSILVLSDLAYAEVYFDDNPPPSVLQVPGAIDITVEFTSMSKTYSMPGWRMGFAVGNERIIAALGAREVLSRLRRLHADPGRGDRRAQRPGRLHQGDARNLQASAATCWSRASAAPAGTCRRRAPRCSPGRRSRSRSRALGSVEFSKLLVEKAEVAVSPGIGFGEYGEGFVRIALVENEQRIRQAARNVRRFLETGAGTACTTSSRSPRGARFHGSASLKVGVAGLGTVGAALIAQIARQQRGAGRALRPCHRDCRGLRALEEQGSRRRSAQRSNGFPIRSRWRARPTSTCSSN